MIDDMKDGVKIIYKAIIKAKLVTETPLRIGSGYNEGLTDILVLQNKSGQKLIPATSMAGVLRRALANAYGVQKDKKTKVDINVGETISNLVFGNIDDTGKEDGNQSMITISDVILDNAEKAIRDGVAIDYVTNTGIKSHKYDYEVVERGATGDLFMEITVRKALAKKINETIVKKVHSDIDIANSVENAFVGDVFATVVDLLATGISIGSMTTKGFGKIKATEAKTYVFEFPKDKEAWLQYIKTDKLPAVAYNGQVLEKADKNDKSFKMSIDLAVKGSLLVADYDAAEARDISNKTETGYKDGYKKLSAVQMQSKDCYVIPGTSVKGVLRNRGMHILMQLTGNEAASKEFINSIMGDSSADADGVVKSIKSRFKAEEIYIKKDSALTAKVQTRNRIDRFTGGTMDTALFSEEPLWQQEQGNSAFTVNVELADCDNREAGFMLLLLKDIFLGNVAFGGGKSIGRGFVLGHRAKINYKNSEFLIGPEGKLVKGTVTNQEEVLQKYVECLVGNRNE